MLFRCTLLHMHARGTYVHYASAAMLARHCLSEAQRLLAYILHRLPPRVQRRARLH